jgi:hypothetical protein
MLRRGMSFEGHWQVIRRQGRATSVTAKSGLRRVIVVASRLRPQMTKGKPDVRLPDSEEELRQFLTTPRSACAGVGPDGRTSGRIAQSEARGLPEAEYVGQRRRVPGGRRRRRHPRWLFPETVESYETGLRAKDGSISRS